MANSSRSAVAAATKPYQPSSTLHMPDAVALAFQQLRTHFQNHVEWGCQVKTPTTPSAQAAGVGNTTWSYDIEAGRVRVGGVALEVALGADQVIHSGSLLAGLVSGNSCIAAIVMKNITGTVSLSVVKGTPAVTGAQVAPTDAEIEAALGANSGWIKLAECLLNRTGDATVTESVDPTKRPAIGVNVDANFGNF